MLVLSGGTGTPKLLTGMVKVTSDFCVVVNTAEDVWISGNKVCPDIDSVIYALSGIIDREKWWGIENDTFTTHEALKSLNWDEVLMIGDRDRATHIMRSELLRKGYSLTEATKTLARSYGLNVDVYPMCEEEVETIIVTDEGEMHFQEFWVAKKGEPEVLDVYIKGIERARIPDELRATLEEEEEVLIGPSNPVTSIMPILSVEDFAEILKEKRVVAISPIIGNKPFSGPAGKFMRAKGYDVSPLGVLNFYSELLDVLIVDVADENLADGRRIVATNTFMRSEEDCIRLANFVLKVFERMRG